MRRGAGLAAALWVAFWAAGSPPALPAPLSLPEDPYFGSVGSWGESYQDQWAIQRVGFTGDAESAWHLVETDAEPVVVAVIDTGLDWHHLDLDWKNLWRNPEEVPDNGVDDDRNGFVDDVIGWDFVGGGNKPWDYDGHGTMVAGIIAATWNNGAGIAGINPFARIMVVKALNTFGHARASNVAHAVVYATDNGARIINLSVGGKGITRVERRAIEYAEAKGVLVVVAAGNDGKDVSGYGPAGLDSVVTVASTDLEDRRAPFSNWGRLVDVAAPGLDVLSLRARRTDTLRDLPDSPYEPGSAYVGEDRRYYRSSGTSFSAPIVAGVASLLFSQDASRTAAQVKQMLLQSARDVGTPGFDRHTGYGLVDARAALRASPAFFVESRIASVEATRVDGGLFVAVVGTADADRFESARVEIGRGKDPESFERVGSPLVEPVRSDVLALIPAGALSGAPEWTLRVMTVHRGGPTREARFVLTVE